MIRLLILLALVLAGCTTTSVRPETGASERIISELTDGWSFRFEDSWSPETAMTAPAEGWREVAVPHTWNRLGEYRIGRTEATDNRQGKGWYRRTIDGALLERGKRHFLEFDAVGNVADVWLNGTLLGRHAGAFTRFRVELTDALDYSGPNLLLVRADNSNPEPGSSTQHVIPLLGDFFIHGGIYRPARLISVPRSHIDLADYGGPGLYAAARPGGEGRSTIDALVRLAGVESGQRIALTVLDAAGETVARAEVPLGAGQGEARVSLQLADARLWDGRADPYLYRIAAELWEGHDRLDRVEQPLGIRGIRFDPDEGFFLNGERLELRGVSRHQDWLGRGWALTEADNARDMAIIAEMGANSVRVAHYPQDQRWFDLADDYGMIVWAEMPFVNKVSFGDAPASPELVANARTQMIEMIRQNFNHPSIVTWGIGNEVDIDLAFGRLGPMADARPLLRTARARQSRGPVASNGNRRLL